jgi:succinate-acetate transporter protein
MTNFVCALFELLVGNTFAWTIFGMLGGYFMSMGALLTPAFGVSAAYAKHPEEFRNAMGIFNCCWAVMFIVFLIVSFKTNIFMVLIFGCVTVTCALSAVADFKLAAKEKESAEIYNKVRCSFLRLTLRVLIVLSRSLVHFYY